MLGWFPFARKCTEQDTGAELSWDSQRNTTFTNRRAGSQCNYHHHASIISLGLLLK